MPDSHPPEDEIARLRVETYCLGLLASEMGEATQVIGNGLRFGLRTPERDDQDGVSRLEDELGDIVAALRFAVIHGIVEWSRIEQRSDKKLAKLLDPDARDNLGRRLAPEPPAPGIEARQGGDNSVGSVEDESPVTEGQAHLPPTLHTHPNPKREDTPGGAA